MITECRACSSRQLDELLSLGQLYLSDFPKPGEVTSPEKYPLDLYKCSKCQLVQLANTVDQERLFRHFWYESSLSPMMKKELADIADNGIKLAHVRSGDIVLDIGCNDGTLLSMFHDPTIKCVGFEPAVNLAEKAWPYAVVFPDFFDGHRYLKFFKKAKLITSIAMFYDLARPGLFLQHVAKCLSDEGVLIVQMNYLPVMLQNNAYDNIVHEHVGYYSLMSLQPLLQYHGLEAFKVELNNVNGGSFRCYIGKLGQFKVDASVSRVLMDEQASSLDKVATYQAFHDRIKKLRTDLFMLLAGLKARQKTVYAYGVGTRGNTILQYSMLDSRLVLKACDANRDKYGRVTVGTKIPIISKEEARGESPDYFLVLPHFFKDEIIASEQGYLEKGGRLIFPLPQVSVYDKTGPCNTP